MFILGLGYQRRQGKDTLARLIHDNCGAVKGRVVTLASFAGPLKREVNQRFADYFLSRTGDSIHKINVHGELVYRHDYIQLMWEACYHETTIYNPVTPAPKLAPLQWDDPLSPYGKCVEMLQWWGTEYRRNQDPLYWLERAADVIRNTHADVLIFTDCRFANEANFIKILGGDVWCVRRTEFYQEQLEHASEHALANWPFDATVEAPDLATLARVGCALFEQRYR